MYVEPSGRPSPRDPWSFRQTGVEHRYEPDTNRSYIILLHPKEESAAQERLEDHASSSSRFALASHPLNVHLVILSSYLVHWQSHIESLAETLSDIVSAFVKNTAAEQGRVTFLSGNTSLCSTPGNLRSRPKSCRNCET